MCHGAKEDTGGNGAGEEWWRGCWRTGESLQGASPVGIKLSR